MKAERTSHGGRVCASWARHSRAAAGGCLLLAAAAAMAVPVGRDYYHAKESREDAQSLGTVEQFHIGPGMDRMKGRNFPGALADFEFILVVFPNHPVALSLVSELCDVRWKDVRCDADAWFEKAIARNPSAAQTFVLYGLHLQRQNRLPQAIESYKQAISLNPTSANAHYNLALAYFDQKQFDLANRHANLSYTLGMTLPGLRDKLIRAGKWKPLDAEEMKSDLGATSPDSGVGKPD